VRIRYREVGRNGVKEGEECLYQYQLDLPGGVLSAAIAMQGVIEQAALRALAAKKKSKA
jgi:hypothetical protein